MPGHKQLSLLDHLAGLRRRAPPKVTTSPPATQAEDLDDLIQAIRGLCDQERAVLCLVARHGRTRAEVAVSLAVSEHTAKKRMDQLASRELIAVTQGRRRDAVWALHPLFLDRARAQGAHAPPALRWPS